MDIAISKNGIPIRLTDERWFHISTGHPEISDYYFEILEAIENPEIIYHGNNFALIAIKLQQEQNDKYIVVIYKEVSENDGFVITAYLTDKINEFQKKQIQWKQ